MASNTILQLKQGKGHNDGEGGHKYPGLHNDSDLFTKLIFCDIRKKANSVLMEPATVHKCTIHNFATQTQMASYMYLTSQHLRVSEFFVASMHNFCDTNGSPEILSG